MLDPAIAQRIRTIFLQEKERVTIEDAAAMLGQTTAEIRTAIEQGDIETITTCRGLMIDTREVAEQALQIWPMVVIEEALGRDASMVLPDGLRSRKLTVRLPRVLIQALHILAQENGESADALLARELFGLGALSSRAVGDVNPGIR